MAYDSTDYFGSVEVMFNGMVGEGNIPSDRNPNLNRDNFSTATPYFSELARPESAAVGQLDLFLDEMRDHPRGHGSVSVGSKKRRYAPRAKPPNPFQVPLVMPDAQVSLATPAALIDSVLANYQEPAKSDPTLAAHLAHLQDMTDLSRGKIGERVLFNRIKVGYEDMAANSQAPTGRTAEMYGAILAAGEPYFAAARARREAKKGQPDPFVRDTRDHPSSRVLVGSIKGSHAPRR
jgi:hypothetical protein